MKEEFTAIGTIVFENEKKRLAFKSPVYFSQCVNRLPTGAEVSVTVSTKKATRSQQQLRYYWVLMNLLSYHTGYTSEELHDFTMRALFGTKTVILNGKAMEVRKSISNAARMPKYDAQEALNYALELCNDLGVIVPSITDLGYLPN